MTKTNAKNAREFVSNAQMMTNALSSRMVSFSLWEKLLLAEKGAKIVISQIPPNVCNAFLDSIWMDRIVRGVGKIV